jgi:DNA repair protein RadC
MLRLPLEERPRERLLACGADSLSSTELLAILLVSGTKGKSVLEVAHEMILHFNGIQGLLYASIEELMQIKGIGKAKAIQLKAAFGLANKCLQAVPSSKTPIKCSQDAFEFVKKEFEGKTQEALAVILRDIKGNAFHSEIVSVGTISEVLVHPREVFYPAVRHHAKSFILAHNHPSGDPSPSQADREVTKLLLSSSRVMGIELDDHLIIGGGSFVSLWERGIVIKTKRY